jgi:dipeptidyl aminopeptidase/acylaminoacyl peptidase
MLINALIADANQDFDVAIYPNRQHSISEDGARPHLYKMIDDFLSLHLRNG